MKGMWQDLKFAARMLRARPGFTSAAVLSLALGVGACTAIFSVVDAVLLRPLPYPQGERIVQLWELSAKGAQMPLAEPNYADVRARSRTLEAVAQYTVWPVSVTGGAQPLRTQAAVASGEFFKVLGVAPAVGRAFADGEDEAVVSHGLWQTQLGGRADLGGVTLRVEGRAVAVVGVMPPEVTYPRGAEVWLPRGMFPPHGPSRTAHNWKAVARLREGASVEQARAELSGVGRQLKEEHGDAVDAVGFAAVPLQEELVGNARPALLVILAAVGFLLLVACTNVANLLLAQATARQKEFAVRAALGARRLRLARQLITENALIALSAAALGVLLSFWGVDLILALNQGSLPRAEEIGVDARALAFTLALSLGIAAVLGLVTALQSAGRDVHSGLKEGSRGQTAARSRARLRDVLVVAQFSLALMLLIGAGLLGRSLLGLLQIDPGFQPESAVAMNISLPPAEGDEGRARAAEFYRELLARLETLPGVAAVGGVNNLPLTNTGSTGQFLIDDDPNDAGTAEYRKASAGYFAAMGIPLLRGRLFDAGDGPDAPPAAVVSQSLAEKYFPGEDPVGRRIQFGNMDGDKRLLVVVGVVGDVRERGLDAPPARTVYANAFQRPPSSSLSVVVRARGDAETLAPAMRRAVESLNPELPMTFRTLEQVFSSSFDQRRFSLVIFGFFAAVALGLAALGLYGVMSYTVARRTNEIGIRMALGAQRRDVLRMIVGQGMRLAALGVCVGLVGAFAATRLMMGLLYGVSPADPLTFVGLAGLLAAVALVACLVPARRATKVDPMVALRYE